MANTASAETGAICKFENECVGVDACNATTFELELKTEGTTATLSSDLGEISGNLNKNEDGSLTSLYAMSEGGDHHLLTVTQGVARYTIHMPSSELAMYYLGACTAK